MAEILHKLKKKLLQKIWMDYEKLAILYNLKNFRENILFNPQDTSY